MAFTKGAARHDEITIDGTDVSNSFRTFGFTGTNTVEDVTGFSVTGNQETVPGTQATGFTGEAYYTPELEAILRPLFANRTIATVTWQADGLISSTFDTYTGECYLNEFSPSDTVGAIRTMTVRFDAADATGIVGT